MKRASTPLCRYCMARPVRREYAGFCCKDHAARFIIQRFDNWYEWNPEYQTWDVSGAQSGSNEDDEQDRGSD